MTVNKHRGHVSPLHCYANLCQAWLQHVTCEGKASSGSILVLLIFSVLLTVRKHPG